MGKIIGLVIPDPVYPCPHCGKEYKTAEGLERHIEKEHAAAVDLNEASDTQK